MKGAFEGFLQKKEVDVLNVKIVCAVSNVHFDNRIIKGLCIEFLQGLSIEKLIDELSDCNLVISKDIEDTLIIVRIKTPKSTINVNRKAVAMYEFEINMDCNTEVVAYRRITDDAIADRWKEAN